MHAVVRRIELKIDMRDGCPRRSHAVLFVDHDDAEPPSPHSHSRPRHTPSILSGAIRAADATLDDDLGLGELVRALRGSR